MDELTYSQDLQRTANLHTDFILEWEEQETVKVVRTVERDSCRLPKGAFIESFEDTFSGDKERLLKIWSPSKTNTSSAIKTVETLKQLTDIGVIVPNSAEIKEYLRLHPDMLNVVLEVCRLTRACFSPSTQLSLDLYHDPEVEDEYLTLYVRQEEYQRETLKIIKAIHAGYGDLLKGKSGWILVTTDFEPPI